MAWSPRIVAILYKLWCLIVGNFIQSFFFPAPELYKLLYNLGVHHIFFFYTSAVNGEISDDVFAKKKTI